MWKCQNTGLLFIMSAMAALLIVPFALERETIQSQWQPGDPELIVISPHNEAIRTEFEIGFSRWHAQKYGKPVKIDWRSIGGTSEIMRYLQSEFIASFKAWSQREGLAWPLDAASIIMRSKPPLTEPDSPDSATSAAPLKLYNAFRNIDDPARFGAQIDLFFGGGTYDHGRAGQMGLSVPPWPQNTRPTNLFMTASGVLLIPDALSGEVWNSKTFIGTVVSTFGICSNPDRLKELGIDHALTQWAELTDFRLFGQVGVADPTKSGSIAKAFEMMIQQRCMQSALAAGFTHEQVAQFEAAIANTDQPTGDTPPSVPREYQQAIEAGWRQGLEQIREISANARYFTDAAGKVPIDVGNGDAAAGIAIDFYGRYQANFTRDSAGNPRMQYHTPKGGSSVSADPISLLRGAPNRELATRFIEFVISTQGQQLWTYRSGTPGGPTRFALRRLPIRRDFYPAPQYPALNQIHKQHLRYAADPLDAPSVNPYALAQNFIYYPRWTASLFSTHRDLIKAMAIDSATELKQAWVAIHRCNDPVKREQALRIFHQLPQVPAPLQWATARSIHKSLPRTELMRIWTIAFRDQYRRAAEIAGGDS